MNIFVAGTDTGIGKTFVSGALCLRLGYRYWKPVQSGLEEETDREWIARHIGEEKCLPESYRLREPLSPHASARIDKVRIETSSILERVAGLDDTVIEGAGGLMVPLNDEELYIDLIATMNMPLILVARSTLGTINHTLLSLAAARARGIDVMGVAMVGPENASNREAIETYGRARVLAQIPIFENANAVALRAASEKFELQEVRDVDSIHA